MPPPPVGPTKKVDMTMKALKNQKKSKNPVDPDEIAILHLKQCLIKGKTIRKHLYVLCFNEEYTEWLFLVKEKAPNITPYLKGQSLFFPSCYDFHMAS